ncbi:MAG: WG repeat-containing protein [Paludibacteraceae bacterium]|nr:WG repeat-containing protein [Paludibacteraceae bacterium]
METKITNPWKKVLIASLAVIAVAVFVFVCLLASIWYERNHQITYWKSQPRHISPNIVMVCGYHGHNGFVQLRDIRTGQYTTPELNHVFVNEYNQEDSLVVFRTHDRLRGYLNANTGKIIIPARFDRAWNFSEGIAGVLIDGVVSFVNEEGKPAFEQTFPIYYTDHYDEIAFQFHNGLCVMRTMDGKWGMINTKGEWAVEPVYNFISAPQNGFRIVYDGNKYGLLTTDGQPALPVEYDDIRFYSVQGGIRLVKDGYAKVVDHNLNTIVPFVHDGIHLMSYVDDYRSDMHMDGDKMILVVPKYWRYDIGSESGVIDIDGNVIIPAKYYMVRMVNENLFEAEVTCGGDHILINSKGQYVGKSGI